MQNRFLNFVSVIVIIFIFSFILVTSSQAQAGQWIQNTDDPWSGFDGNLTTMAVNGYSRPCIADLNGDGLNDIVIGSYIGKVNIYYNDGASEFIQDTTSAITTDTFGPYATPFVGDLSGDGHLDIIVGDQRGNVNYFTGDGAGNFTEVIAGDLAGLDIGSYAEPLVTDINDDGFNDLILGENGGQLKCYLSDGAGLFTLDTTIFSDDVGSKSIPYFGDLDGDTDLDILIGNSTGSINPYLKDSATGSFSALATGTLPSVDVGTYSVPVIADIDNDSDNDVIVGAEDGKVYLYRGDGTGNYTADTAAGLSSIAFGTKSRPAVSDINSDGDVDVIVGNSFGTTNVAYGDGTGNFTIASSGDADTHTFATPVIADINSDGNLDLLFGSYMNNLTLYTGDGSGAFTLDASTNVASLSTGLYSRPITGDFNGDENIDILVGNNAGELILFLGDGANTFTLDATGSLSSVDVGSQSAPCAGYINDDEDIDLIVGTSFGDIQIFLGDGSGNFVEDTTNPLASIYTGVPTIPVMGDVNGDAQDDLLLTAESTSLLVYLGDGNGNFNLDTTSDLSSVSVAEISQAEIADVNHDHSNDVIISYNTGDINIYSGDSTGSYTEGADISHYQFGMKPVTAVADTDNDCDNDIIIGSANGRIYELGYDGDDNDFVLDFYDVPAYTWYADSDGDGYGNPAAVVHSCTQPAGYVSDGSDCDDANAANHPGAAETCDGFDNDCDSSVDESDAVDALTWYQDADNDIFGNAAATTTSCMPVPGYVSDNTDCDDSSSTSFPGAAETCDGFDNDCDGEADELGATGGQSFFPDTDGDGFGDVGGILVSACIIPEGYSTDNTDCDDTSADIHPFAAETCATVGVDNNCNGDIEESDTVPDWFADTDADGFGDPAVSQSTCASPEGYVADNTDCDDSNSNVKPSATESCSDEVDNNCDDVVNEGCSTTPATETDDDTTDTTVTDTGSSETGDDDDTETPDTPAIDDNDPSDSSNPEDETGNQATSGGGCSLTT
ncbi:MAG: BNR repeat protein, partial [uncultured bacterium]